MFETPQSFPLQAKVAKIIGEVDHVRMRHLPVPESALDAWQVTLRETWSSLEEVADIVHNEECSYMGHPDPDRAAQNPNIPKDADDEPMVWLYCPGTICTLRRAVEGRSPIEEEPPTPEEAGPEHG